MIQEESAILWEMIVCVILSKKVHMNMGPILNGYRDNGKKKIRTIRSKSPVKNRVIQEESAILWEIIVCVILSKKVHMNMGPILNGYRDMVKRRYGPSVQNRTHVHMHFFA